MATKKRHTKLKLTHNIFSHGGPWTSTDFCVNGIPIGTLRTRSKSVRDMEIAKYQEMTQEQLRVLLRKRVSTMAKSIEEVIAVLENFQHTAEEAVTQLT